MTDEDKMGKVTLGIEKLFNFHFSGEKGRSPNKRAKIMGNVLMSDNFLGPGVGETIATKLAAAVTRVQFTPVAIAKAIDLNHGSLNDRAVSEMARIQVNEKMFHFTRGHSLLPFQNRITEI